MALSVATLSRVQQSYIEAVNSCRHCVELSQDDVKAILLLNNGSDTVAAAYAPSIPVITHHNGK